MTPVIPSRFPSALRLISRKPNQPMATPYYLPASADLSKVTFNTFYNRDGVTPEVFVAPFSSIGGVDASALTTDDTYQGEVITGYSAGATIAQWEAVYMGGSSTWLLADGNGSGTYPARGLAVAAGSVALGALTVLRKGVVRNDAWTWTPGGNIYLSNTPGGLSQTASVTTGERVQACGFALTADKALFDFTATFFTNP